MATADSAPLEQPAVLDGATSQNGHQEIPGEQPQNPEKAQANGNGIAKNEENQDGPHHHGFDIKRKFTNKKDKIKTKTLSKPPGGYDPTPLPDAPPGYTVKFTFHRATNLPIADIGTRAADPFVHATLTTSLPKRHKEDPDLTHRTPTQRRTTEAVWEDDWIVANVPSSGFRLKCRLYDEDWPDHNDRLGNVTFFVSSLDENWKGFSQREFPVKKRVGSKRAYLLKAVTSALCQDESMTPSLFVSAVMLGKSNSPPHAQIYTVGPTSYFRHFSPMIGRIAGIQVDQVDDADAEATDGHGHENQDEKTKKYDFQATEIQLQGPVPVNLYHRYVEFRPMIGMMFDRKGIRGHILHKALTHQHNRIYNFDSSTEYGEFEPCSEEASLQFLKFVHFDQGGRIFTYVITLDGLFRFTETGKEFGIDLLSKHTMHSDVATYVACSGEFFIRRLQHPTASEDPEPHQPTHPVEPVSGGPPDEAPPTKPQYYQLVIDNDSGTYRPDKSVLPDLKRFLEKNFPGLGIVTLACDDEEDEKLKADQRAAKKKEGTQVHMVLNRSPSSTSISSDDLSDLDDVAQAGDVGHRSKRERALDMLEREQPFKGLMDELRPGHKNEATSGQAKASAK